MWIPEEEYNHLKKTIPIPCVDLIVINNQLEILLVKRKNEPAKGAWWFPGGRVLMGESREFAALRKLREECGITADNPLEWATFDLFLEDNEENYTSHGISTFYLINIAKAEVSLDEQSSDYDWRTIEDWGKDLNGSYLSHIFKSLEKFRDK